MKKNKHRRFNFIICLLVFISSYNVAYAEKILVKKVKGKQAIIETSALLEAGQTYELLTEDKIAEDVDYKSSVLKSRKNSLTFGGQLDFLRSDSYQSNSYALQGRYGWNFSNLELGALIDVSSLDVGAGATTSVLAGGYFDYNFIANRDPKKIIYGIFTLVGFGSTSYPSGSTSGGSSSTMQLNAGGFITYFIGNTSTALRGELYGIYQQVNTNTSQGTLTGVGGRGLLLFYF